MSIALASLATLFENTMESEQPESPSPNPPNLPAPAPQESVNSGQAVDESGGRVTEHQKPEHKEPKRPPIENENRPESEEYRHLIGFAIGYALVIFFCTLGLGKSLAPLFPMMACLYASVLLTACWSVLGPGPYLKRLALSHLVGALPLTGLALGLLARTAMDWDFFDEIWYVAAIMLLSIVPFSMAAQLPFWFFRGLFGWQFIYRGNPPQRAFSLRDVFFLTFMFALCFAIPRTVVKLQAGILGGPAAYDDQGVDAAVETVVLDDGSIVERKHVLSEDEIAQRRRNADRARQFSTYAMYGGYALTTALVSLFSLPIVMLIFRVQESASGCAFSGLYVFFVWALWMIPVLLLTGGVGVVQEELIVYPGLAIALSVGAVAIPLMVTRETGFQLSSPRRFERQQRTD